MNIIETPGRLRLKITLQWSVPQIWRHGRARLQM